MYARKILVVDDDKLVLKSVRMMLESENYQVLTVGSGKRALEYIDGGMEPGLIILDIGMPDMTGLAFLKKISDADGKPRFPVLILTARPNLDEFFANLDVVGFLAKPCTHTDLLPLVRKAMGAVSATDAGQKASPARAPGGKKRILLAEDDVRVRARLGKALRGSDYDVKEVTDGSQVVDAAAAFQPDVVVLNKILLGTNGDKIARMLAELPAAQDIPVVMYEENADPESARRSLLRGANVREFLSTSNSEQVVAAVAGLTRS